MPRLGLQLYSVRDECARDLEATLRAVAAMGYEGVELHDLYGRPAAEVAGLLGALDLAPAALHVGLDAPAFDAARALGVDRVVVAWADPQLVRGAPQELAARVEAAARDAVGHGLALGYHNHDAEVLPLGDGAGSFLDLLLERDVFLEPDLGWTWWAGVDPVALLERARGRCPLVHVKDFAARGERAFCAVGDGLIDWERVVPAAVDAGAEWLLVEQDESEGSSLEAAERSLAALRRHL